MKKLICVIIPILICTMLLSGCGVLSDIFNSGRDDDYDYYGSDYYDDDDDYDYDYSYDDDDDYDYSYSSGSALEDYSPFWEKKSTGAKCGIFVNEGKLTLFVAALYDQYTFDTSVTYTVSKVGSYYYLYAPGTTSKMGDIRLVDSSTIYLSLNDAPNLSGYYDSVYTLDVDLD